MSTWPLCVASSRRASASASATATVGGGGLEADWAGGRELTATPGLTGQWDGSRASAGGTKSPWRGATGSAHASKAAVWARSARVEPVPRAADGLARTEVRRKLRARAGRRGVGFPGTLGAGRDAGSPCAAEPGGWVDER